MVEETGVPGGNHWYVTRAENIKHLELTLSRISAIEVLR
jgi:hypothetical protein